MMKSSRQPGAEWWSREVKGAPHNPVDWGWELLLLGDLRSLIVTEVCLSPVRFGKPFLPTSSVELGPENEQVLRRFSPLVVWVGTVP